MRDFVLSFWGESEDTNHPNQTERGEKIKEILTKAFDPNMKQFHFKVGDIEVCEHTVKALLTITKSKQWERMKKCVEDPEKHAREQKIKTTGKPRFNHKEQHALGFIMLIANAYSDDSSEVAHNTDNPTKGLQKIAPFDSVDELFLSYKAHYQRFGNQAQTCAIETFRQAFANQKVLKLRGAKGSFETCSICNNIGDAIKNSELRWTDEQLSMVLKLRSLHLDQQMNERVNSKYRRDEARNRVGTHGKLESNYLFILIPSFKYFKCVVNIKFTGPWGAYLEQDAFTESRCLTPKFSRKRRSKGNVVIGNRLIGGIITCGPSIDTRFLYSTDELVRSGANCMIEVVRQSLADLSEKLGELGQNLPRHLYFQFDNCGENKNR